MPIVYPYGHVFALWSEKLVCRKALEGYREGRCAWAAINWARERKLPAPLVVAWHRTGGRWQTRGRAG